MQSFNTLVGSASKRKTKKGMNVTKKQRMVQEIICLDILVYEVYLPTRMSCSRLTGARVVRRRALVYTHAAVCRPSVDGAAACITLLASARYR